MKYPTKNMKMREREGDRDERGRVSEKNLYCVCVWR